jgi:hypothetical protein
MPISKLCFALLFICSLNAAAQKRLYISPAGNDHNPGTIIKPFATLARAQQEARKYHTAVTVYLRKGTYYLSAPVVFSSADSRADDRQLTFRAYPGEKPIISSSKKLALHWQPYKNGIWRADIGEKNIVFDELFINGNLQIMARYPNYNADIKPYGGSAADALSKERVKKWQNPEGGYIHALHQSEWGDFAYQITGKDKNGNLTMEGGYQNNRPSAMHKKFRYVENIAEELDTVNEWYFDKLRSKLYYYPAKGIKLQNATVEVPQLESLFEYRGTADKPVKNIRLEGLELGQTLRTFMKNKEPLLRSDWTIYRVGAVTFEGAEDCTISNCYFNAVGGNAVVFSNYNRRDTVRFSRIMKAGSSGIAFIGDPKAVRSPLFRYEQSNVITKIDTVKGPLTNNYPAECLVYNNLIEGIGRVEKQVAGVQLSMSMDITVSHNTIDDVPRAGINVNEGAWGGHIIEFNDVFNTVLETGDHGSFNSWGRDRYWFPNRRMMDSVTAVHPELILLDAVKTTIIRNNRFRCDHGWDIDLDDGSSNYEIYNNLCLNGGLKLREGFFRKVYNNVIINNSFHPHVWFKNSHDQFERNLVSSAYFPIGMKDWGKVIDNNFCPDSASLHEVQRNGTDTHSLYGPETFVNEATGNYQLPPDSKVFETGFKNFPMDEFGVTSATLKALAHHIQLPKNKLGETDKADLTYNFAGARFKSLNTLGERSATGMDSERGVIVLEVAKTSRFYNLIFANDVVLGVNEHAISNLDDLIKVLDNKNLPARITLSVFRNQKVNKVIVAL